MMFFNFLCQKLDSVGLSEIVLKLTVAALTILNKKQVQKRHQEIQSHLEDCR